MRKTLARANLYPARGRDDLPCVARLLTLSDNVVAIALTLRLSS